MVLLLSLDVGLVSGLFGGLPILKLLESLASSSVSLKKTKLANSAHEDESESEGAWTTDSLNSGLFFLSAEFILESSHAWGSLVGFIHLTSLLILRSVMTMMSVVVSSSLMMVLLLFGHLLLPLLSFLLLGLLLLHLVFHVLGLLSNVGKDLLEEIGHFHSLSIRLKESTTKVRFLNGSSDVQLLSDLRIDILELTFLAEQESVEQQEEEDTVESSPEGDVRVLFSLEPLGNHGSHGEHAHGDGKHHLDHADLEEVVIQTKFVFGRLLRGNEIRLRSHPWEVTSLSDVLSVESSAEQGYDGRNEEGETEAAKQASAAAELL